MSGYVNHQNWINQMVDGDEVPALSDPINPHVGFEGAEAGQRLRNTTLGLNDRPLVNTSRRINASPANIPPVNTSTNDGFPTWVNQELGPDPLATAPDGHLAPFFAGTFSVNALVNKDVSPLVNPGLGTDFANDVPEDAWIAPTMGISSVALNDAGCYFQALPIQGFLQQPASPLGAIMPVVPAPDFAAPPTQGPFACTQLNCFSTFIPDKDRARHESSVHGIGPPLYLCQVPGCIKSIGAGYTRKDKLTEHMWKKHGNLGHVKRT
ncbi:hypothetical protein IFR04_010330 [Cadophora malorum]|uniref:C2H2-type domain-containing protein n=1 Tax=Cadophora malorum TaxID=108018 RepID=A0A8H7TBN4_9HELO|nr:hypothetical protein IFR04_010330 [Cadophora malorum]